MRHFLVFYALLFVFFVGICTPVTADVVKPALIEIVAEKGGGSEQGGKVTVEIRASIEALLTGINGQYKNTQDAPTAEKYDVLRVLPPDELTVEFESFKSDLLQEIALKADGERVALTIDSVDIPPVGYPKVPRFSVLHLSGSLPVSAQELSWYYPARFGDNAVRVKQVDAVNSEWHWSQWQWLRKDEVSQPFSLTEVFTQRPVWETVASYIEIGFTHIVPKGLDHILFVIGIFLFSTQVRPLLLQVTMFTLAHTLTLGMSMLGWVSLSASIVEPLIALSIAYVAIENIFARHLQRHRLVLVFAFGLLHGLGFAGVLSEFGMPDDAFATALISFNIGVELGQLAIIAAGYLLLSRWFGQRDWYRAVVVIPGSLLIAAMGVYWTLERLQLVC